MSARAEGQVLALARRGTDVAQIARRTRLSQDLVMMMLSRNARQEVPDAAASASLWTKTGAFFRWVMNLEVDI